MPCYKSCLYKQDINCNLFLVLVYVDDLLIACHSRVDLMKVKSNKASRFEWMDKGKLSTFWDMQIDRKGELRWTTATPLHARFQVVCNNERCVTQDPTAY